MVKPAFLKFSVQLFVSFSASSENLGIFARPVRASKISEAICASSAIGLRATPPVEPEC